METKDLTILDYAIQLAEMCKHYEEGRLHKAFLIKMCKNLITKIENTK